MGLSASDLWIILRGRDEASRAIRSVGRSLRTLDKDTLASANRQLDRGRALTSMGVGMIAVGAAGFVALEKMGKGAREYEKQAALALTQTDNLGASLGDMKRIGLEVAREIPVAFEEIQPALYDIFSSIDTNLAGGRKLIRQFAKDAVAGGTDLQTATRANLQIMNAYGIKVKDVSKVSDFFFQLVRKGVGTYKEMTGAIGKSIPSAARAGQSYQELGGMIAFLTRQGLTAAQAGTSAARAMDAISHPASVKRLEAMGVAVRDASGEFKPMSQIIEDLGGKLDKLTGPERSKKLQELFKGSGGTIQAKRFFDAAFKNMDEYQKRVKDMRNTNGLAQQSFITMASTSEAKVTQAKNALKALGTEFGDIYNKIRDFVVIGLGNLAIALGKMPSWAKKALVGLTVLVSLLLVLGGLGALVGGAILIISSTMTLLGITLGGIAAGAGIFLAVIALIAGAAYLIYKNWSTVGPFLSKTWDQAKAALMGAWTAIQPALAKLGEAFNQLKPHLIALGTLFAGLMVKLWPVVQFLGGMLLGAIVGAVKGIIQALTGVVQVITGVIQIVKGIINGDWKMVWDGMKNIAKGALNILIGVIKIIWNVGIVKLFKLGFMLIKAIVKGGWNLLVAIFKGSINLVKNVVQKGVGLIPRIFMAGLRLLWSIAKTIWNLVKTAFTQGVSAAVAKVKELGSKAVSALKSLPGKMKTVGVNAIKGLINGIGSMIGGVISKGKELASKALNAIKDTFKIGSPSKVMFDIGKWVVKGYMNGIDAKMKPMIKQAGALAQEFASAFNAASRAKDAAGWVKALVETELTEYRKTGNEVAKGVVDGFRDYVSGANLLTTEDVFGETVGSTAADMTRMLKERETTLANFAQDIETLRSRGLDSKLLSEIIGAGPDSAGEAAKNLANATGAQLAELNAAAKSANLTATAAGVEVGATMFHAGKSALQGFVDGLKATEGSLTSQIRTIAQMLTDELKKQLGIRSPSKVFRMIGRNLPNAVALGMSDELRQVARASRRLSTTATTYPSASYRGGGSVDRGDGGGRVYNNEFYVTTQEIDPRKHAADLGYEFNSRMV